jgi:hypothetical protein
MMLSRPGWQPLDVLAVVPAAGALALLAPLEYSAGRWVGLAPAHAVTVTVVVEGFTALAVAAGRLVWLALALCSASAGVGLARSAYVEADTSRPGDVWVRLAVALGLTGLAAVALAGTHWIRSKAFAATAADQARRDQEAREQQAERERAAAEQRRADAEQAERAAAAAHARALELTRAQAWARRDELAAETELARVQAAAEQARAAGDQQRAAVEQQRAEQALAERMRADRGFAREQWLIHRWSDGELAVLLGLSAGRCRALIAEWREDRGEPLASVS